MKNALRSLLVLSCLLPASADVYIYNTINERLTYQIVLPNGDTQDGVIEPYAGYTPTQATLRTPRDKVTTFKVTSETGNSSLETKSPDGRCYLIAKKDGKLIFRGVSWNTDNGQTQKRAITFFNATEAPQSFGLVDEKEIRQVTVQPGEEVTVEAKNGFHAGNHHLKFSDGSRLDNAVSAGHYAILYMDSRSHGKVQAGNYGWLAVPRNTVMK
ncbi:MAG: hypothetical protein KF760_27625 [Candidatus Eremiobacteraeota bacterium]|nr:hypothetical protein [Candidatus Eremiobacteraeota bacterium]MCW5871044.1 hypothetical protein [Candidatus Eremiobacteraeota bacterium]